ERSPSPDVSERDEQEYDEDDQLAGGEPAQRPQLHGDREHEDDLDVEEDEQHRHEIEADPEAEAPLDLGRQAAFVGLRLRGDAASRPERGIEKRERQADDRAEDHEDDRREVAPDHTGVISLPWEPL